MAKKAAVIAVNPVNGSGLFQYLEAFYENGIGYDVYAVSDSADIVTNSGMALKATATIDALIGREAEYDALVFACGDAIPVFSQNADKQYYKDMFAVMGAFAREGKIIAGHCAAGMMFELAGIAEGRKLAVHPLAKAAIAKGVASDEPVEIDGKFFTAQTENTLGGMVQELVAALN